jgi:hypothetical protein
MSVNSLYSLEIQMYRFELIKATLCNLYTRKPHITVRLLAPLIDERCNYNAMIEYVTIRKLMG